MSAEPEAVIRFIVILGSLTLAAISLMSAREEGRKRAKLEKYVSELERINELRHDDLCAIKEKLAEADARLAKYEWFGMHKTLKKIENALDKTWARAQREA